MLECFLAGFCRRLVASDCRARNTRFRVIRALQSLSTKKLSNPAKKHSNIPL